jgi:hypothetical protein
MVLSTPQVHLITKLAPAKRSDYLAFDKAVKLEIVTRFVSALIL